MDRLTNDSRKNGCWKEVRKGWIKAQNASLPLASTLFVPTKLVLVYKWVKRH